MTWLYCFLIGMALAVVDVALINNFDGALVSISLIASLLLMRSLRKNRRLIALLAPTLVINYLYGDIRVFYFFIIFYLIIVFIVQEEWMATKVSEFKLSSVMLLTPYALLMIFRIHFWPNIVASSALSFLFYILGFLILKHDKKRILSKQGY